MRSVEEVCECADLFFYVFDLVRTLMIVGCTGKEQQDGIEYC